MNENQTPTKPAAPAQDQPAIVPMASSQNPEQGKPVSPPAAPATKA